MKILIVANKFPYPPKDGGAIAKLNMIKGFYQQNIDVTVAAINTSKHYYDASQLPSDIKQLADFRECYVNTDLSIGSAIKNLLFSNLPYNAERFINKTFEDLLIQILKEKQFDIIQLEGFYLCPYIPIIREYSNAKISYRSHNIEHEIWDRTAENTQSPFKRWYISLLAKRIAKMELQYINSYDVLVPITNRDGMQYTHMGNMKPMHICPTGINADSISAHIETYKHLSLFHIGGLDWSPNQQGIVWFLENCWMRINQQYPHVTFKIAGRNAPHWMVQLCNKYQNVFFCGEVDNATTFYEENAIMIVPLLAGSGMRIKIIEGLALGKLIISTSIGAEGIAAKHNKEIMIANTADEFVIAITEILKNTALIPEIGKNAITFVRQNFDNITITSKLLHFYEHTLSHN